jgi:hypothetical protein
VADELQVAPMRAPVPGGSAPSARPFGQPVVLRNGAGRAALVLGVTALLFSLMPGVGLALAAAAITLGVVGSRRARRLEASNGRQAHLGLFTGAVAGVLAVIVSVVVVLMWSELRDYQRCVSQATTTSDNESCTEQFRHAVDAKFP